MIIVTGKHLDRVTRAYPDAANELAAWAKNVRSARWQSMVDVQETYRDADQVAGYVIFNVRRNRYRLVTVIHFAKTKDGKMTQGHVYVRSFLTHKEYDNPRNWDKEFGS